MRGRPFVIFGATVLILFGTAMTDTVSAQGKWWKSDRVIELLGLTMEQSDELESVFQDLIGPQRDAMRRVNRLEEQFSAILRRDQATEEDVMAAIDEVEAARSDLGKLRALMLYRMRRVLTPDQRDTLEADRQRARERSRGGQGDRSRPGRDGRRPE
jgi:Spy/CpxP family protein refolding chaperone